MGEYDDGFTDALNAATSALNGLRKVKSVPKPVAPAEVYDELSLETISPGEAVPVAVSSATCTCKHPVVSWTNRLGKTCRGCGEQIKGDYDY